MTTDYQTRILRASMSGNLQLERGTAFDTRVEHDDSCPLLQGRGGCHCNPNVIVITAAGETEVLEDGSTRPFSPAR